VNTTTKSTIGILAALFVLYTAMLDPLFTLIMVVVLLMMLFVMLFVIPFAVGPKKAR